jgi:hypothetical protein
VPVGSRRKVPANAEVLAISRHLPEETTDRPLARPGGAAGCDAKPHARRHPLRAPTGNLCSTTSGKFRNSRPKIGNSQRGIQIVIQKSGAIRKNQGSKIGLAGGYRRRKSGGNYFWSGPINFRREERGGAINREINSGRRAWTRLVSYESSGEEEPGRRYAGQRGSEWDSNYGLWRPNAEFRSIGRNSAVQDAL